jgi:hypothetical protein
MLTQYGAMGVHTRQKFNKEPLHMPELYLSSSILNLFFSIYALLARYLKYHYTIFSISQDVYLKLDKIFVSIGLNIYGYLKRIISVEEKNVKGANRTSMIQISKGFH